MHLFVLALFQRKVARGDHRYSPENIEIYNDHPRELITDETDIRTLLKHHHILLVRIKQAQTTAEIVDYAPVHPASSPTIEFDVMISYRYDGFLVRLQSIDSP